MSAADPWTHLAQHPGLLVVEAPIAERGRYYHRLRQIVIRKGMTLVEQRSTLWHELIHAERGDEHCTPKAEAGRVEREAARRAIPISALADAIAWSNDPHEVADHCKVTVDLLQVRLESLHPAERGLLKRVAEIKGETA